ncbi:MAG: transposase [Thermodesulfobacteriota bacterium]
MIVIGEKINGTRKQVAQAIQDSDAGFIRDLAVWLSGDFWGHMISGDIHQVFVDNHEIVSQHEIVARLSRIVDPRYPHRVTQRGVRSMNVFHEESDRREYLGMLGEEIARHGVSVLVWFLMTNHVHFVAVPHAENSLAKCFGRAHWRYTRMKSFAAGGRGYLLQGRFSSCVPDERHLLAAARYVEQNPVRAGMANAPWDYPWLSARSQLGTIVHDPLVTERAILGLVQDWERLLLSSDEGRSSSL